MMDVSAYFRSLSLELDALKDRVRHVIDTAHWPTDGEWKESVLRTVLRRHLPSTVEVGRGFVVAPDTTSRQIDVLIYDSSKPLIFKDGDLVILASDAVKGIIEVKSRIHSNQQLKEIASKLADHSEFLFEQTPGTQFSVQPPFIGLFAYEWHAGDPEFVLDALYEAARAKGGRNPTTRIINHAALGASFFARYWQANPAADRGANYCSWHAYNLEDRAFGYFIHNVVDSISSHSVNMNPGLWFPIGGKEAQLLRTKQLFT
jgi:Domain of unknown function (DUF6602)